MRLLVATLLVTAFVPGCSRLPESFAPPPQRASLDASPSGLGHFVNMSDPNADAYVVSGFREKSEGDWRWAHEHPVLRFRLPRLKRAEFHMDFTVPESTFRLTGPVTLTISVNGHVIDRVRCDQVGPRQYAHEVAREFLRPEDLNLVAIDPDRTGEPNAGEKLSFVLVSAGFSE